MYQSSFSNEFYSPAFAAKLARSTAFAVFGTTSTPDGTADEASVSSAGTISSNLPGLPWRQSGCRGRLGSDESWQKPEKRDNPHRQRMLYEETKGLIDESDSGGSLKVYILLWEKLICDITYCSQSGVFCDVCAVCDATHASAYSEGLSLRWTVSLYLYQVFSEELCGVNAGISYHVGNQANIRRRTYNVWLRAYEGIRSRLCPCDCQTQAFVLSGHWVCH